jgi:hypothetical protein
MAAPERFAEKSDLPLQRGHRPYMAQQQHDSVAFDQADGDEEICHLIGFALNIAKGHSPSLATLLASAAWRSQTSAAILNRAGMAQRNEA